MEISKPRLLIRLGHWLAGFVVHILFSLTSLAVAIKDWDKDCEDDNSLEITGSAWLIASEAVLILYASLLLPSFLFWEAKPKKRYSIAVNIYTVLVVLFFSIFLVAWDLLGVFLLFEEIEDCKNSGLWVMSVISLVRSWINFMYPVSVVIVRELEEFTT